MVDGVAQQLTTRRLAARLRLIRRRRGLTARELAELCSRAGAPSLTRSTIAKIESGIRQSTTGHETAVLARALGESVEQFLAPLSDVDLLADMLHDVRQRSKTGVRAWAKAADLPLLRVKEIIAGQLVPEWEELERLLAAVGEGPEKVKEMAAHFGHLTVARQGSGVIARTATDRGDDFVDLGPAVADLRRRVNDLETSLARVLQSLPTECGQ